MSNAQMVSVPRSVDIAVTGKCNLTCKYCFYADQMAGQSDLPIERWFAFLDELGELGVMDVTLTGGEVFTRRDLFDLIDRLIANRMRYSLLTNGTLVTEETIEKFTVGKRRSRLNYIQISIDGSTAEIHDKSRPKSFERAIRGVRLFTQHGFPLTVRVTLNRHNLYDIENIAALLLDDIGLPSFSTNEAFPMGAGKCAGELITLTLEERRWAMKTLKELNVKYNGRISASAGPLALANQIEDMQERMARGETSKPGCSTLNSCGGVFQKLAIEHDGTIVACQLLPTHKMGKIGEVRLVDVWRSHPNIDNVRERRFIPLSSLDTCTDCKYAGFCAGGCPGLIVNQDNPLFSRDPHTCLRVLLGEI